MAKSILQSDKECYLCRKRYNLRTTRSLEEHHILFGRGRRELSEQYGLKRYKVYYLTLEETAEVQGLHAVPVRRCRRSNKLADDGRK